MIGPVKHLGNKILTVDWLIGPVKHLGNKISTADEVFERLLSCKISLKKMKIYPLIKSKYISMIYKYYCKVPTYCIHVNKAINIIIIIIATSMILAIMSLLY